jgi:nucleotide-binding universal stress UspA family protein
VVRLRPPARHRPRERRRRSGDGDTFDVFVERIGPASGRIDSVLLPTAGGVHLALATTVAAANDVPVETLHVLPPGAGESCRTDGEAALDRAVDLLEPFGVTVERTLDESDDVAGTIVDRSADHDLTVVGAMHEGLLQQLVFGATSERSVGTLTGRSSWRSGLSV